MAQEATRELDQKAAAVRALLGAALARHRRFVYANSLGAEAMVLTDIIWSHLPQIDIFSIDTGRLHEETYELLERLQHRYQRRIRVVYPDAAPLEQLVARQGVNGFYDSLESAARVLPRAQGRAVSAHDRRLSGVGHGRAPRAVGERAHGADPGVGCRATDSTRSARCSSGAKRRCGSTSARASCRTMRCTTASFRASAARPARARFSPARAAAPAAGGGNNPSRANAVCIRE